jgi:hypothetical protein
LGELPVNVVRRLFNNQSIINIYSVEPSAVLSSTDEQTSFPARVLPDQVELYEKQSTTMD